MGSLHRLLTFTSLLLCILPCISITLDDNTFTSFTIPPNSSINPDLLISKLLFSPDLVDSEAINGTCAVCTVLIGMTQQYAEIHDKNIDDFIMNEFCSLFSHEIEKVCHVIVQLLGPGIIQALTETISADEICRKVNICKYPQCNLFVNMTAPHIKLSPDWTKYVIQGPQEQISLSPLDWLLEIFQTMMGTLVPLIDIDGDHFTSAMAEERGYHWRGRDCNDLDAKVRPGRKIDPYPGIASDYNCNGISGINNDTKMDYKDLLCSTSGQMGVAVIGDSAGIFAQIPQEWATAADWNKSTLGTILPTAMDQGGHPQFSAYTGYYDEGYHGPVHSVYKYLYERNKCNFRDYQNVAVSGASSGSTLSNAQLLTRDQTHDHPLLVILELAANDVCFDNPTTPDQFRKNILGILDYLDTVLPAGSHLVSVGLVNGSLIHQVMHGRRHPMGMTYDAFYDYLNCMGIYLCPGYLTSNMSRIEWTAEKAMELNQVYLEIFSNYTAVNYDIIHYDFPAQQIIDEWTGMGGDPAELISAVDGFHPSQIFNMLFGDFLWNSITRDRPEWLGQENPNNDLIESLFGDQGGY